MPKVKLEGYILVPDSDLSAVVNELINHTALTQAEEGNLIFQVTQDDNDKNRFDVYEEFIDQQAFDLHQERVRNSSWGSLTTNIERHYDISTIE